VLFVYCRYCFDVAVIVSLRHCRLFFDLFFGDYGIMSNLMFDSPVERLTPSSRQ